MAADDEFSGKNYANQVANLLQNTFKDDVEASKKFDGVMIYGMQNKAFDLCHIYKLYMSLLTIMGDAMATQD